MTPTLLLLFILTPAWLALAYYGTRKSLQATGIVAVPGLIMIAFAAVTPVPPEGILLAPDQQVHFMLCRIMGGYMLLTSFLSALSLLASRYVDRFKALAKPETESLSDGHPPTPPNS